MLDVGQGRHGASCGTYGTMQGARWPRHLAGVPPLGLRLPGPADWASRQQTSWAALRSLGSQVNGLSEKLGSDVGFVSLNTRNATC